VKLLNTDTKIRLAAFKWLEQQSILFEDVFPRSVLAVGFEFEGIHIPLVSPQGIFRPRQLTYPLSITSTPLGPYDDSIVEDGILFYKYRGTDPGHRDNVGLRKSMTDKIPLIYFLGITPGKYFAIWPVYIINDNPQNLSFSVTVDDKIVLNKTQEESISKVAEESIDERRRYITASINARLHQKAFRERVIYAYQSQCAFCRLKHQELLDAAHILPDGDPEGLPTINNGISLCKIHHAAFDKLFVGIRPDYIIEVRSDILKESDGPMLLHGLQELQGQMMLRPSASKDWPNCDFLRRRYLLFKKTA
jgi:putative restriction endonuclease